MRILITHSQTQLTELAFQLDSNPRFALVVDLHTLNHAATMHT